MQINQVCQEIHSIKLSKTIQKNHSPPSTGHKNKEIQPSKCEMGGKGYTRLTDNKKYVCYEDPCNNPYNPIRHDEPAPPSLPPPEPPSLMFSHASSESSEAEVLASFDKLPSCLMDGTFASTMVLSSSQNETKESLDKQDSRGGGLACPDKTSEWRSLKEAGTGDCPKLPTMEHWQEVEEQEC